MRVSVLQLDGILADLVTGTRTREDVAQWASEAVRLNEENSLQFEPPAARRQIWEAISYLLGVDLKSGPETYLHVDQDFENFLQEWRRSAEVQR